MYVVWYRVTNHFFFSSWLVPFQGFPQRIIVSISTRSLCIFHYLYLLSHCILFGQPLRLLPGCSISSILLPMYPLSFLCTCLNHLNLASLALTFKTSTGNSVVAYRKSHKSRSRWWLLSVTTLSACVWCLTTHRRRWSTVACAGYLWTWTHVVWWRIWRASSERSLILAAGAFSTCL